MNNPTIFKIEYMDRDDVSIPETISEEVGSELFSGTWVEMDMAPTTGELSDSLNTDDGNKSHTTLLNFFVAGLSTEQKMELNILSAKPAVYRVTDGEGKQLIIGTDMFRAYLRFGEEISPTAAGRKGYNCTVQCKSRYGPLLYGDSYSG